MKVQHIWNAMKPISEGIQLFEPILLQLNEHKTKMSIVQVRETGSHRSLSPVLYPFRTNFISAAEISYP